jgi:anti-sigma factor RsiW
VTCREFQELLIYLAFGDLDAAQTQRAHAHLEGCASCVRDWGAYREVTRLAGNLPAEPIPFEMDSRLRRRLGAPPPAPPGQHGGG